MTELEYIEYQHHNEIYWTVDQIQIQDLQILVFGMYLYLLIPYNFLLPQYNLS